MTDALFIIVISLISLFGGLLAAIVVILVVWRKRWQSKYQRLTYGIGILIALEFYAAIAIYFIYESDFLTQTTFLVDDLLPFAVLGGLILGGAVTFIILFAAMRNLIESKGTESDSLVSKLRID